MKPFEERHLSEICSMLEGTAPCPEDGWDVSRPQGDRSWLADWCILPGLAKLRHHRRFMSLFGLPGNIAMVQTIRSWMIDSSPL